MGGANNSSSKWFWLVLVVCLGVLSCDIQPWNDPYPKQDKQANTFYTSFNEPPRTLDPAKSFASNEYQFIGQIYEPPLQYHYLLRPYVLIPLTATELPQITYLDSKKRTINNGEKAAYSVYTIHIKPNIYYQPHPALARDAAGNYYYLNLPANFLAKEGINTLADFKHTGTRELIAADYVYQIKRLADPQVQSPIFGLMNQHIVGLEAYANTLNTALQETGAWLDLRQYPLAGVRVIDRYTYEITLYDEYPQFIYWLAMPFFAPMPWEADLFSHQPGMAENNLTLDWYPIGTGAYYLTINNPNLQMVLTQNPNFHPEYYPTEGEPGDQQAGLLTDAGQRLPFINQAVFALEKESIPRWNKFLQGYYDTSGISSDSFDQAIQFDIHGETQLTDAMHDRNIQLITATDPSLFFYGFNMLDDVVGGDSVSARKLRQAISIAINQQEFINIFLNGRGLAAQGPIPPGIFGYHAENINPYVYQKKGDVLQSKSLTDAQQLLIEAGYPQGRDANTGEPLILYYDAISTGGPDDQARLAWLRKQLAKLRIQLHIRATQYNRFQEKIRTGNTQIFFWGWHADYPDPENFLFLFYGPNSKVKHGGENSTNYTNAKYDALFEQMQDMADTPERLAIIHDMLDLLQNDAPAVWAFYPTNLTLSHAWNRVSKPIVFGNNTLKYAQLDPVTRAQKRYLWNQPIIWPVGIIALLIIIGCIPVIVSYRRKEHRAKYTRDP